MPFLKSNIDRAIVLTKSDLWDGFLHPLGFRIENKWNAKYFVFIPRNLVDFSVGWDKPTDETYVYCDNSSFEDYLKMCKQLASDCTCDQKEEIQKILEEIIARDQKMKLKAMAKEVELPQYLRPLNKENWFGKSVIALAQCFGVLYEKEDPFDPQI